jgi:Ca2+-binding RTX toxin-like protein
MFWSRLPSNVQQRITSILDGLGDFGGHRHSLHHLPFESSLAAIVADDFAPNSSAPIAAAGVVTSQAVITPAAVINGTSGNDTLTGTAGDDVINGGAGDDNLSGGDGNDLLDGGDGNDTIDGGAGIDTITFASATSGIAVNLNMAYGQNTGQGFDTPTNVENIQGSAYSDFLFGSAGANQISGGAGNDNITGYLGNDVLTGGADADRFNYYAGDGNDTITDLTSQDTIQLWDNLTVQSVTQVASNVVILLSSGGQITCLNTDVATVTGTISPESAVPPPPVPAPPNPLPPPPAVLPPPPGSIIPALPNAPDPATSASPFQIGVGTTYTVSAASSFYDNGSAPNDIGFDVWGGLTNNGMIWADSSTGSAAVALSNTGSWFMNYGTVVALGNGFNAAGVVIANGWNAGPVVNYGSIYAIAPIGNAYGIEDGRGAQSITNNGLIAAQAFTDPAAPYDPFWPRWTGKAYGIKMEAGVGPVINNGTGQILVEGDWAAGIWSRGGALSGYDIDNRGLIRVVSTSVGQPSYGLLLANTTGGMHVINSGTIAADVAIYAPSSGLDGEFGDIFDNVQVITNTTTGILRGDVILRNGADILTNNGEIDGKVDMGAGNDTVDTSTGKISGTIYLGTGDDQFVGSALADIVSADAGNDTLQGNDGDDLLIGGAGDDTITGGAGNDGLDGGYGNDRLVMSGGDAAYGGSDNDRFELSGYDFAQVDGGSGFDTLVLPSGGRVLDLSMVASTGRVSGIEDIVLGGSKELVVRASDIAAISGSTALRIETSSTDKVDLVGGWIQGASQSISGITYLTYTSGGSTLLIKSGATVVVGATPPANGVGLDAVASGGVAPTAAGYGFDTSHDLHAVYDPIKINNQTLQIQSYEVWHNFDGVAVVYSTDYASETTTLIQNDGEISSSGVIRTVSPVSLWNGSIVNNGLVEADNIGAGVAIAITVNRIGIVTNNGDVVANALTGDATGVLTYDSSPYRSSLLNSSTGYIGAYSQSGFATGVSMSNNSIVPIENDGLIQASGSAGAIGVDQFNAGGSLTNTGEIDAWIAPGGTGVSIGYAHYGSGTLTNGGHISADVGVYFVFGSVDTFTINNSGQIDGAIVFDIFQTGELYGNFNLTNSGWINGSILVNDQLLTVDKITNNGVINGDISLAGGLDVYDGSEGSVTGSVHGGAGDDKLTGGAAADSLLGDDGNDTISGGAGNDMLTGGAGNDVFLFNAGDGSDTVTDLAAGDQVKISGYGAAQSITQVGGDVVVVFSANDQITFQNTTVAVVQAALDFPGGATSGDDVLTGTSGADALAGGAGNDTYIVDNPGDTVTENPSEGTDTVQSSVTFTLGANLENLTLTGTAAINGTGNALANVLIGNSSNNILDGGAGADTMSGGAGNDTYIVDNPGDTVTENANEGTDTVKSSISYTLGANVENLTLTGTSAINGTGNALANVLIGNSSNNILDGGAGADSMSGGAGNDTYVVDNSSDVVTENASEGTDTVQSSISYTLGANVENLTLTGTAAKATGNALANVLVGNSANNTLDGAAGADSMSGGAGNDIYIVDNAGDIVTENANEGSDTVKSSLSFTLGANVEKLTLTGTSGINGTGNSLANTIVGNSGANILTGGAGNDVLTGGSGNDTFVYKTGDGQDTITDFASGDIVNVTGYSAVQSISQVGTGVVVVFATGDQITFQNASVATVQAGLHFDGSTPPPPPPPGGATDGDDTLSGGTAADTIHGLGGNDTISGNGGNDMLYGDAGNDSLNGGAGNDTLDGGTGNDAMNGGTGNDIYFVDSTSDKVTESLNQGTDEVRTTIGYTLGSNVENATALGTAAINLTGNTLANTLTGNSAVNTLSGGGGNDILRGGGGNDVLTGGTGSDKFVFEAGGGNDKVTDFVSGTDKIDLHLLGITSADVHTAVSNGNTVISVDANHDGTTDFTITLNGVTHLSASDYIFA